MRTYFVFESSKGRKDLVLISQDLDYCRYTASGWHSRYGFTYTVYWVSSSFPCPIKLDDLDWRRIHCVARY